MQALVSHCKDFGFDCEMRAVRGWGLEEGHDVTVISEEQTYRAEAGRPIRRQVQ